MTLYSVCLFMSACIAFVGACCRLAHTQHVTGVRGCASMAALVMIVLGMLARVFHMPAHAALLVSVGLALFFMSERREVSR